MKKRLLIPLLFLIGCIGILLVMTIFQLYKEAEKVQRNIFVNEVLIAGETVVDKIDATLKNDTIALSSIRQLNPDSVPASTIYKKFTNRFLLDSTTRRPIGIINTSFDFDKDNTIYALVDTVYFDTTYLASIQQFDDIWGNTVPANPQSSIPNMKQQLVEMDSNDRMLLNHDFLHRIIKEALAEENINSSFDFALYNAYTSNFVVEPTFVGRERILQSEYIFKLKANEKFITPHYLILFFSSERSIFFQRMSTIVIMIICLIILILLICGITMTALYRQKKTADVKSDFINNMTHEFKTPISTISLACEVIEDKSINDIDAKMAYVSIIKDENVRLQKMVENILLTAQLNKGQLRMSVELVDVHSLIQKIMNSISLQVSSSGGQITAKLQAEEYNIFGDPVHIENTIINLTENAIKYSNNKPHIEIRTHNENKNIVIEVEDNGIGIAKKDIKKIFNEFYRVHHGNRHDTKGFGLGLGYVKKIVSLHHGNINVKSELGKGSVFIVSLPIKM